MRLIPLAGSVSVFSSSLEYSSGSSTMRGASEHLVLGLLGASCLPAFEAKAERFTRAECLACQKECDGKFCPKVCAGLTATGEEMTCALDKDCLDNSIDPYGGMGCNVRRPAP